MTSDRVQEALELRCLVNKRELGTKEWEQARGKLHQLLNIFTPEEEREYRLHSSPGHGGNINFLEPR